MVKEVKPKKVYNKKPRADKTKVKARNVWKVAEIKVKDPNATYRDIQKKTWLAPSTISKATEELIRSWRMKEIFENYEKKQRILSNDIKNSIDDTLLTDFVLLCGSKLEATKKLEEFMSISIWNINRRRKWIKYNTRYAILHKHWFKCCACWNKPNKDNDIVLHIDHIVPYSIGWLDTENNYQVLCHMCNCSKGNDFIYNHWDER